MSANTAAAAKVAGEKMLEYYWTHASCAVVENLPPPKLDFFFNNFPAFGLRLEVEYSATAKKTIESAEFLLLDFLDLPASQTSVSRRNFTELIEDLDDGVSTCGFFFGRVYEYSLDSVVRAIDDVCEFYSATPDWYQIVHSVPFSAAKLDRELRLDATLLLYVHRAVVEKEKEDEDDDDELEYKINRRYDHIQLKKGDTTHRLVRRSDECTLYAKMGHALLDYLRVLEWAFCVKFTDAAATTNSE